MHALHRLTPGALTCLVALVGVGCTRQTPEPAAPAPAPSAAAPAPSADASPAERDPSLTGVLTEAGFKALHGLKADSAPELRGAMMDLEGTRAYLSLPAGATAPVPGVVVIHEWWGLNDHIKHWSDRLAADGYAAIAVDLYGGKVATTPDAAMTYMKGVDGEAATSTLLAAHRFLTSDERVKAPRTASIGWCFGGKWSLGLALASREVDAAVVYYGHVTTEQAELMPLEASVLAHFGNKDSSIPPKHVDAFEAALKAAGKDAVVHRYDAGHAFANPSGNRYVAASAETAWKRTREFLAKRLKE